MNLTGIRYGADIAAAAAKHHLDPALLAAVAAQETGGPGRNSGNNVVGADGHGRGLFQIDDRSWSFARTSAVMDPAKNADMAATILQGNLERYGGDVPKALSAYNTGAPNATGSRTTWSDGTTLGYADSVMRHYGAIVGQEQGQAFADSRETSNNVNALASLGASQVASPLSASKSTAQSASTSSSSSTSASALALQAMQPLPQPLTPPTPVPTGSQAQAAAKVGAQADDDEASLVDEGDIFGTSGSDDEDA
jgi:hypothetical protein